MDRRPIYQLPTVIEVRGPDLNWRPRASLHREFKVVKVNRKFLWWRWQKDEIVYTESARDFLFRCVEETKKCSGVGDFVRFGCWFKGYDEDFWLTVWKNGQFNNYALDLMSE